MFSNHMYWVLSFNLRKSIRKNKKWIIHDIEAYFNSCYFHGVPVWTLSKYPLFSFLFSYYPHTHSSRTSNSGPAQDKQMIWSLPNLHSSSWTPLFSFVLIPDREGKKQEVVSHLCFDYGKNYFKKSSNEYIAPG